MSQMAVGNGRLVSGVGTAPCRVIQAHTQVRAAEGLQGFKFILQKARQVPVIYPVPGYIRTGVQVATGCYQPPRQEPWKDTA